MSSKNNLEVGNVVDFSQRTSAYVKLPKYYFFHNIKKDENDKIRKEIPFSGRFANFAGHYIITDIKHENGNTIHTCQKVADESIVIEYITLTGKTIFVKPYKVVGNAKCNWEICEMY